MTMINTSRPAPETTDTHEVEDQIALLIAQETARLISDLDRVECRLDLVERALRTSLSWH